ncbi:MAG TPA: serine/threonine-protein kinase [Streptosporangiaceae bacterium]
MLANGLVLGGRYELAERVGAGGFSEVWRAADLVLARPVAVKLPYPGFTQDDEALARFRAEARNAGRLSHENVARVYDYGEPDPPNPPFLVLELIDGPPLSVLLGDGPLAPDRAARLLAQAAAGLAAAHQAGLIHRDIKPGNLMIAPGDIVKVTDFGISYAAGSAPLTCTGMLVGTPAYLAPERGAGASATAAGDLYSLGIVGYQCLTGELPFAGNPLQLALAHQELPLPPLPGSVPAGLAALILALTAKDPAARPGSAAEVARWAAALAGHGGSARLPARRPAVPAPAPPVPAQRAGETAPPGPGAPPWPMAPPAAGPPLAAVQADDQPTLTQPRPGPAGPRRAGALAAAMATAALAGGLFLAGQAGPVPTPHAVAAPPATHRPADPRVRLVDVHRAALIGQPVTAAARQLRRHGLKVRVRWQLSAAVPGGTVLAVQPAGPRPAGSVITLIGAVPPPPPAPGGRGHGHGHGPGHGGGGGHGHGHGGPGNGNGGGVGGNSADTQA